MAISDRRKIAAVLVLAAGGIGLVGVSSGATFSSTVAGSFTVQADFPPTPTATATAEPTPGKSDDPKETESPSPTGSASAGPTPTATVTPTKTAKLTTSVTLNSGDWLANAAPVFTYTDKEIEFTGTTAKRVGGFTAQNTGDLDLRVTATVTLSNSLKDKFKAELRLVGGTTTLKAMADQQGDSATYELWLTPVKSGDKISKGNAKDISVTFAYTTV
ncbi:hypothetical protein ACWC24_25075 [Streptomyces sp. NPDC001443]